MNTIETIIKEHGGLAALAANYIRIENEPYEVLVIEHIGTGPRGLPMVSVAHYYEQNGDAMRDPDMVFEVDPEWRMGWGPISYQQDGLGIYQEAVWQDRDGRVMLRPSLVKELKTFAREWDRNIAEQGYLEAYRRQKESKNE